MKRVIIIMLLSACSGDRIEGAPQPGDVIQLPPIEWRIVDRAELERVYQRSGGTINVIESRTSRVRSRDNLTGFVGIASDGRQVMYTLAPTHVDDRATCVIGHEVLHFALEGYHK